MTALRKWSNVGRTSGPLMFSRSFLRWRAVDHAGPALKLFLAQKDEGAWTREEQERTAVVVREQVQVAPQLGWFGTVNHFVNNSALPVTQAPVYRERRVLPDVVFATAFSNQRTPRYSPGTPPAGATQCLGAQYACGHQWIHNKIFSAEPYNSAYGTKHNGFIAQLFEVKEPAEAFGVTELRIVVKLVQHFARVARPDRLGDNHTDTNELKEWIKLVLKISVAALSAVGATTSPQAAEEIRDILGELLKEVFNGNLLKEVLDFEAKDFVVEDDVDGPRLLPDALFPAFGQHRQKLFDTLKDFAKEHLLPPDRFRHWEHAKWANSVFGRKEGSGGHVEVGWKTIFSFLIRAMQELAQGLTVDVEEDEAEGTRGSLAAPVVVPTTTPPVPAVGGGRRARGARRRQVRAPPKVATVSHYGYRSRGRTRAQCDQETAQRETEVGTLIKSALLEYNATATLDIVRDVGAHLLLMRAFLSSASSSGAADLKSAPLLMIAVSLREEGRGKDAEKTKVVRDFVNIPGVDAWEQEIGRLFKGEDGPKAAYALATKFGAKPGFGDASDDASDGDASDDASGDASDDQERLLLGHRFLMGALDDILELGGEKFGFITTLRNAYKGRIQKCLSPLLGRIPSETVSEAEAGMQMVSDLESEWALLQNPAKAVRLGMAILVDEEWPREQFDMGFDSWLKFFGSVHEKVKTLVLRGLKPWTLEQQARSLAALAGAGTSPEKVGASCYTSSGSV